MENGRQNGESAPVKIKYCSVGDGSMKEIEELLLNSFIKDENTMRLSRNCEGGQVEDYREIVQKTIPAHDWSLSRLAVDAATGRVAGVCLCDVAAVDKPSHAMDALTKTKTEACQLLGRFLNQLMFGFDVLKDLNVDKVMWLNIVTVDPRYRRHGISLELRRQSIELARQAGLPAIVDQATSPFTRKALAKLGFKRQTFLPFTESVLADVDKVDLSQCGPDDGGALMILRL